MPKSFCRTSRWRIYSSVPIPSLADIPNNRVRRCRRRKFHVLAKRTPGVGVVTMQTNHVGSFQGVEHFLTIAIHHPSFVVDHYELGARIAQLEHAHMRPQ